MTTSRPPFNSQNASRFERIREMAQRLITPDSSIKEVSEFRRAQLLSSLALVLSLLFFIVLLYGPSSYGVFIFLTLISLISYALSRTKYYKLGTYLFSYAFTAIGFFRIYQGEVTSIEASIASTVHISLVISSALLSQRGFLGLVILSTIATFTAPFYSDISLIANSSEQLSANIGRTGGIVFSIGMILYSIQVFRAYLDREKLKELTDINRELEDVKESLEQRIDLRTAELEKANQQVQERAARFQVISEISQEISANVDQKPKELLNLITRSISEKLGFYHIGIFLLDKNREFAVLRAANSQGGQHMVERHHQLKVGGTGIVGYVAQAARPRIALDTGTDAVFFNNPDLPKTRSEIALPLKYGSKVIGVLDVQSTQQSAFKDEDANLLSTLANQIAIVINNIIIAEQGDSGFAAQQFFQANKQQRKQGTESGFSYLSDGTIATARQLNDPATEQALASGETVVLAQPSRNIPPTLAIPVKFRDQVIGIIHVQATEKNRRWTEDEVAMVQSISDRAALALENARLFEETVRRADQEETIAKVTTQIGASTDFKHILQTTIQELGQVLGVSRSFIQMGPLNNDENQ
ncbi:MAG: GAF domain-containing protein [Anaerolineales bacterium]|jgi:GAF domain-containing protein|uniref:GAF domain-containing protein n=1 Tax=Candidatus Villigracilis affinis TaxID=3140682 RepID=UPI001D2804D8|nr:GAF domain-containing protein [Anaerolineales bacterium]MBK9601919.1 GAF domain-containing protein [Anaerolineales bacterium]MBL0348639.1 GAF domain-containing protein [Anaerolineales bacterium]